MSVEKPKLEGKGIEYLRILCEYEESMPIRHVHRVISSHGDNEAETGNGCFDNMHYHDGWELGICHSGRGIIGVGDQILEYKEGDITLIPAGVLHSARSIKGDSHHSFIHFDFNKLCALDYSPFPIDQSTVLCFVYDDKATVLRGLMQLLLDELNSSMLSRLGAIHSLISLLLINARRCSIGRQDAANPFSQKKLQSWSRIVAALDLISKSYAEEITSADLCSACSISQSSLWRAFIELIGKSPQEYLLNYRIRVAATRVIQSEDKFSVIAHECGFHSLSSFNRQFRKIMGHSPSTWKRDILNEKA